MLSVNGARLYFVRVGEGPLMLFVYGHPDGVALYEMYIREFGRDHLAVAANLRGYTLSDAPERVEAYAMSRLLGDVHGLLDHFGRDQCILVGNDWGGYLSWVFAVRRSIPTGSSVWKGIRATRRAS